MLLAKLNVLLIKDKYFLMNNSSILIRIKCADSAVHLHFKRITDNLFVGSSLNVKHTDSSSEANKMCIYKDNLD